MPEIGRWGVVDPLSEKYWDYSIYGYAVNNPVLYLDPDGNDVIDGIKGKEHRKALSAFMRTPSGRAFIASFARKGQTIAGYTFKEDGKYARHILNLSDTKTLAADTKGKTSLWVKKNNGKKVRLWNLSAKSAYENKKGFKYQIDINIANWTNEVEATETLGHEAFIHAKPDIESLTNLNTKWENGEFGKDGAESLRFVGAIGKFALTTAKKQHKLAVNGKNVDAETFINEIVKLTGNNEYRKLFEEWKKRHDDK